MLIKRGVIVGLIGCLVINMVDSVFSYNKEAPTEEYKKSKSRDSFVNASRNNNITTVANFGSGNELLDTFNVKDYLSSKSKKKFYSRRTLSKIIMTRASLPIFPYRLKSKKMAKITAYEPSEISCGKSADGKTSIMKNAYELTGVAADPLALPYGTVIYIPEVGYKTVDDTGRAMKRSWRQKRELHIDLRFLTVKDALKWGVQFREVEIYERND